MGKTGRSLLLTGPREEFVLEEATLPTPNGAEMLVRQEMCGICGTDVHVYQGHLPGAKFPFVLGHEIVGVLEARGDQVRFDCASQPLGEGDLIYVVPGVSCGQCYFCRVLKTPVLCTRRVGYGFYPLKDRPPHFQGGYGDYVYLNVPNSSVIKLDVHPEVAVSLEPLAVGVHQAERAQVGIAETVVIQGCGAIGMFALIAAREAGAHKVIVIGAPRARLELSKQYGADVAVDLDEVSSPADRVHLVKEHTYGRYGADVAFECTGVPQALIEGIDMLRRGGRYVVAGHFTDQGEVELNPFRHFNNKEIQLVGVWSSDESHFLKAYEIMRSGRYELAQMITHRVPYSRVREVMEALSTDYRLDGQEILKAVLVAQMG